VFLVVLPVSLVTLSTGVAEGSGAVPRPQNKLPLVLVPLGVLGSGPPRRQPGVGARPVLQSSQQAGGASELWVDSVKMFKYSGHRLYTSATAALTCGSTTFRILLEATLHFIFFIIIIIMHIVLSYYVYCSVLIMHIYVYVYICIFSSMHTGTSSFAFCRLPCHKSFNVQNGPVLRCDVHMTIKHFDLTLT